MRNQVPLRWIEVAEARTVLTAARFERAPQASWPHRVRQQATRWLARLGAWLAPTCSAGSSPLRVQPALVRQAYRRAANDDAGGDWW